VKVILKGGSGSGHRGHAGRPGSVGGSLPGVGGLFEAPEDWVWDAKATASMMAVMTETRQLYGTHSTSDAAKSWTSSKHIWHGDNKFEGGWHPLAKSYQREILDSKLPKSETLYRGVRGDHAEKLMQLNAGDELILSRVSSTSRSIDVSSSFRREGPSVMLVIRAAKGMPGMYIHDVASEIILPAYSTFNVVGKIGNTIHMEYTGVRDPT